MKMVLVIYDAGIDEDLRGVLDEAQIDEYTKLAGATGAGRKGHRFGTPIWPGTNNLLWIALPDERVSRLIMQLDALKKSYLKPHALQVFVFPVEGN
ncbi:MAG: hypothetical protein E6G99_01915 [Bacillati bacterium ANGP1]|uniref:Uncharacterized protein n=1 Tax=Candidatus Segetimicrobium genomatis TaxID=2569760 RepID=A0A537LPG2_9BACT|nr:MAG: hypothetical protein E6G99_01915 [Terrabacteria group bacterium ANGP1]TMJ09937.1 MAG: hypothetical protein E6G98_08345 [Terrabacteria group bacterium ANGP1]